MSDFMIALPHDVLGQLDEAGVRAVMAGKSVAGLVCQVGEIPPCYFCNSAGVDTPGPYDFKTRQGPWANGCRDHYLKHRLTDRLGVGQAQYWLARELEGET